MTHEASRAVVVFQEILDAEGKPTGISVDGEYEPPFPDGTTIDHKALPATHRLAKRATALILNEVKATVRGELLSLSPDFELEDGRLVRTLPGGRKQIFDGCQGSPGRAKEQKLNPSDARVLDYATMPTMLWATELAAMARAADKREWNDLGDAIELVVKILWSHRESKGPESKPEE